MRKKKQRNTIELFVNNWRKEVFSVLSEMTSENSFDTNFRVNVERLSEIKGFCQIHNALLTSSKEDLEISAQLDTMHDEANYVLNILWRKWREKHEEVNEEMK